MRQRRIAGRQVGAIGLGCMGMSFAYGKADPGQARAVLERALALGLNHWDTADMYGAGHNELLLSDLLRERRDEVFLATKFGNVYDRSMTSHRDQVEQGAAWIVDGTPAYVRRALDASLRRLGVDHVDLYYQHRVDPRVPIEVTVGAMAELVRAGKVRALGLSEVSAATLRRAHAVHPIAAVQNELSLWTRDFLPDVVPLCAELGIAFVPYSPLGRGFLSGTFRRPEDVPEGDWRRQNPRFQAGELEQNLRIVRAVEVVAVRRQATPAQVALAWVLAQGEHVCPIPGTKRVRWLEENAAADGLRLTAEELAALNAVPAPSGQRYPERSMRYVNA